MEYLTDAQTFSAYLDPVRKIEWVVYAKRPFSGPKMVLAYLSGYTHCIAISNSRIVDYDQHTVTFKWKDYWVKGPRKFKTMTLPVDEFIHRFLMHVLPARFHRIRHFGLLANHQRKQNLPTIRKRLGKDKPTEAVLETSPVQGQESKLPAFVCRTCGTPLIIIEILGQAPRGPPN
jgi:hypothetical protein